MKKYVWLFVPFLWQCSSTELVEEALYQPVPLSLNVPSNFPPLVYDMAQNPPTEKGFELGKKLFYEGRLASDGIVSCGFCHIQEDAFTHHGHSVSHGVNNKVGNRNTPAIQNLGFQTSFMWDGTADVLERQPIIPLLSELEMNGNLAQIMTMLKSDAAYVKLFKQAFADGAINSENMMKALAQFMVMVNSFDSKFDKFRRKEVGGTLTADETAGYAVFNQKCASCHATDLFTDNSFRNNGLPINPAVNDLGRFVFTEKTTDRYKFKVPSLRNIEKTAPYMHDGRFGSLEAVLEHYDNGVENTENLDPILKQSSPYGIRLSATEKKQLVAFLKTLTDTKYLTDKRFSEF